MDTWLPLAENARVYYTRQSNFPRVVGDTGEYLSQSKRLWRALREQNPSRWQIPVGVDDPAEIIGKCNGVLRIINTVLPDSERHWLLMDRRVDMRPLRDAYDALRKSRR